MVSAGGFEPPSPALNAGLCQLSYADMKWSPGGLSRSLLARGIDWGDMGELNPP